MLFLAVGLLHWVDETDAASVSPLLLIPCDSERASPRDPFYLKLDEDDAVVNPTLRFKLDTDWARAFLTWRLKGRLSGT